MMSSNAARTVVLPASTVGSYFQSKRKVVAVPRGAVAPAASGFYIGVQQRVKRVMDVVGALVLLTGFSPVFLVLMVLTRRDGGPAFYGHRRMGKDASTFDCYKFRTMVCDSDAVLARHLAANPQAQAEWDADHKLKNDPRVTRLGKWLRRVSLDELPQLYNVLIGDMSLIGPRPIVWGEIAKYKGDIAYYYRVRPGITGLWQVSGRNDVSYAQRVRMDRNYVRRWSLWLDFVILYRTVPALLSSRGAY